MSQGATDKDETPNDRARFVRDAWREPAASAQGRYLTETLSNDVEEVAGYYHMISEIVHQMFKSSDFGSGEPTSGKRCLQTFAGAARG
ncbi:MAG: hypothetical protein DMF66_13390 [Acidobacteria bacterium]|nr:MAG: hypothetical protein DMF66_13390 [Acidobacteriota bacterium]